jgi:hypothetical protein
MPSAYGQERGARPLARRTVRTRRPPHPAGMGEGSRAIVPQGSLPTSQHRATRAA